MKIDRIDHIAVNTVDIEESVKYYEEMFGFQEVNRADMGECVLVYLEINSGSYLELFDLKGDCVKGDISGNLQGLKHIAFHVDDIIAWEKKLREKKAEFVMQLTRMEPIKKDGILIKDPNGVIVELSADY